MPDTQRSLAALQALLPDNLAGDISPQDVRDVLASTYHHRAAPSLSVSGAVTYDARDGDSIELTLVGNITSFVISNGFPGQSLRVTFIQGGAGGYTLNNPSGIIWESGLGPTLTLGVGRRDAFTFAFNGTNWIESAQAVQNGGAEATIFPMRDHDHHILLEAWKGTVTSQLGSLGDRVSALEQGVPPAVSPIVVPYTYDVSQFNNPGRGLFTQHVQADGGGGILNATTLNNLRTSDQTNVVRMVVNLASFLGTDTISAGFLTNLTTDFAILRDNGFKCVLRPAYNYDGDNTNIDVASARMLTHINQLATNFNANKDVILYYEMGFIGKWGEQHYSGTVGDAGSNGFGNGWWNSGTNTPGTWTARLPIIQRIMEQFEDKFIAIRYPRQAYYYMQNLSAPYAARIAFSNDSMLADAGEFGTWDETNHSTPDGRAWVEALVASSLRAVGGEQENGDFTDAQVRALYLDFGKYRWTTLNYAYNPQNITALLAGNHPTHTPTITLWEWIKRHLGYRFSLVEGRFPAVVVPTETFTFELDILNSGFQSTLESYIAKVKFGSASEVTATMTTTADVAKPTTAWLGYQSASVQETLHTIKFVCTVPALGAGQHAVSLSLVDPASGLQATPAFRIRFANTGIWDAANGRNSLGLQVTVE